MQTIVFDYGFKFVREARLGGKTAADSNLIFHILELLDTLKTTQGSTSQRRKVVGRIFVVEACVRVCLAEIINYLHVVYANFDAVLAVTVVLWSHNLLVEAVCNGHTLVKRTRFLDN